MSYNFYDVKVENSTVVLHKFFSILIVKFLSSKLKPVSFES